MLIIDDDPTLRASLRRIILAKRPDWTIVCADDGQTGLVVADDNDVDAVICDMQMPGMHGVEVLASLSQARPSTTRIALTGWVEERWRMSRLNVAHVFLDKPCDPDEVIAAVERGANSVWALDGPANQHRPRFGVEPLRSKSSSRSWTDEEVDWS